MRSSRETGLAVNYPLRLGEEVTGNPTLQALTRKVEAN
jgi:hypothetical protein